MAILDKFRQFPTILYDIGKCHTISDFAILKLFGLFLLLVIQPCYLIQALSSNQVTQPKLSHQTRLLNLKLFIKPDYFEVATYIDRQADTPQLRSV